MITLIASACMNWFCSCGDGRPRPSKPSEARQLPGVAATMGFVLKLAPDVAELVETRFRRQPFGGSHRAFSKSEARLGVVAKIDAIAGRIEDHLMHADRVALAKGNDFEFLTPGLAHNFLNRDRSSRRSVFLRYMMTLENLARVIVFQSGPRGRDDFEEQVHSNGKIRSVEDAGFGGKHHFAQARHLVVPAGGSDDDVFLSTDTGFGVSDDRRRCGEVYGYVEGSKETGIQGGGASVFVNVQSADLMPPLAGHFRHQRSGFATAEN